MAQCWPPQEARVNTGGLHPQQENSTAVGSISEAGQRHKHHRDMQIHSGKHCMSTTKKLQIHTRKLCCPGNLCRSIQENSADPLKGTGGRAKFGHTSPRMMRWLEPKSGHQHPVHCINGARDRPGRSPRANREFQMKSS